MRKATVAAAAIAAVLATVSRAQATEDAWWDRDKALHFGISAGLGAAGYGLSSLVLEQPLLSPDAIMVAGLVQTRRDDLGRILGSLVVINPATGQMFVLEAMPDIYDLQWSQ